MSKLIDLTGKTFNEWTVIRKIESKKGTTLWECRCSCGKIGIIRAYDLKNGRHKSCGHDRKTTLIDLTGQTFGELKVLEYCGDAKWRCECSLIEDGLGIYGDTEDEIMSNMGYIKVYDSGNLRLTWCEI